MMTAIPAASRGMAPPPSVNLADYVDRVGFAVTRLLARVRYGTIRILPRTHRVLQVHLGGSAWLADEDELLAVLAGTFGLSFPAGTRCPPPGADRLTARPE